jgi:hypothetical protein
MSKFLRSTGRWAFCGGAISLLWFIYCQTVEPTIALNSKNIWIFLKTIQALSCPISVLPIGDLIPRTASWILWGEIGALNTVLYAVAGFAVFILKRKAFH